MIGKLGNIRHFSYKPQNYWKIAMSHYTNFKNINEKPNFPALEEDILAYWKEIDAFKQQLKKSEGKKPYSFYDGPPFATGLPHYGHICAGTIKDVITRYASMTGHHVPRKFGWDCHGLPVEFEIDKKLKIDTKAQREEFGLANYNAECRKIVMRYSTAWEEIVTRTGRWIDFQNDYKTLDPAFMESVWWVFKQIYDKGHVYRGCKIMPYSNGCNTCLSNFEAGLNFKDVFDPAVYITFPLLEEPEVSLIGWTTTPWTLPSNLACVVHPDFNYVRFKDIASGKVFIVAQCRLKALYGIVEEDPNKKTKKKNKKKKKKNNQKKGQVDAGTEVKDESAAAPKKDAVIEDFVEVISTCKGTDLENKEYTPLYSFLEDRRAMGCFKVLCDTYVTPDAGTGVVHTAPAYGEDDYRVCMKYGIIIPDEPGVLVDDNGFFTAEAPQFQGQYLKDADKNVIKDLKERDRLFKQAQIKHSYPFCWRSETPLIYKAVNQWFIGVTKFKDRLVDINKTARWVPEPIQTGRFHNWLADANDWCFSRDRFWGTPIPIWVSDDGEEVVVVGSVEELQQLAGLDQPVTDLHRESIDHITIPSKMGKGDLKRIPEVFDCWFESGSMPYASVGYPKNIEQADFDKIFPADFIGEGLDQTRGWFYTLNVISAALFDKTPYRNLIVNGMVLAEDGNKMSKSKNNFDPPMEVIEQYGADAIRLYLMNSPLVRADPLKFSNKGVFEVVKTVFMPWYNVHRFLLQNVTRWEEEFGESFRIDHSLTSNLDQLDNVMDRWIISSSQNLIRFVRTELDNYRLYSVLEKKVNFLVDLSNWYVKLNRDRLKGSNGREDWTRALTTLYTVLMDSMLLMAPYVPFLVETFYQNMKMLLKEDSPLMEGSIHFLQIPDAQEELVDEKLLDVVDKMQRLVERTRVIRDNIKIPIKQGVQSLTVVCLEEATLEKMKLVEKYIKAEVNVQEVHFSSDYKKYMHYKLAPNHRHLGGLLGAQYGKLRKGLSTLGEDYVNTFISEKKIEFEGHTFDEECFSLTAHVNPLDNESLNSEAELDFAVVLDSTITEELKRARFAREFVNRVQRLRKASKLNLKDNVIITYAFENPESQVALGVAENLETVQSTTRKAVLPYAEGVKYSVISQEVTDIDGEKVSLLISGNILLPVLEQITADFPEQVSDVLAILGSMNADLESTTSQTSFSFQIGELTLELKKGTHYTLAYP